MTEVISHPYFMTERKIVNNQQFTQETAHKVNLHQNFIESTENYIALESVLDISYRALSIHYYFLYLHTDKGVLAFQSKINPAPFVAVFREIKASGYS
ncbi:hypothetical protein [Paraliobacillus sediminis]|uniref:hypothetical protein n=1 Tax=Paraliobacillus sediminis TaxID=1885916 RepID=UPI000E3DB79C|nr:hypothetical protein [Paraliobacillus sediminis]